MADVVTVGVDGTPESTAAVHWAAREAQERTASLRIVHVATGESAVDQVVVADDTAQQYGERIVRDAAAQVAEHFPALTVRSEVIAGEPGETLTELSRTSGLLVIGSRGFSSFRGFLVGSAALPTVAHAWCPVVLVRATESGPGPSEENTAGAAPSGKATNEQGGAVVVGVDIRHPCEDLLTFAFETARRWSAPLKVLHGWEPPPYYGSRPVPLATMALEDFLAERAAKLTEMIQPWRDEHPSVTVDARAVLQQAVPLLTTESEDASLTVVGRRQRSSGLGTHVGPVAHGVMHHTRTPVAVVPHA
ncbi:universal stress protein [Streptomyces sp. enrichment culture]|uniref:universal stress protein n=1 Tax=Streptomyces sp. enrichment culture TaxID=1795815 RepID=UPI003F54BFB8